MSPITNYPQSAGGGEPFATRAKRAASPQRISNGYTPTKSNGILSPRKTSKRFFRRPTLEKSPSVDFASVQANEKKKQSAHQPKVEIIYKDSPQSESEAEESNVASLKKAFEVDGITPACGRHLLIQEKEHLQRSLTSLHPVRYWV